jgi:hypothetical protein
MARGRGTALMQFISGAMSPYSGCAPMTTTPIPQVRRDAFGNIISDTTGGTAPQAPPRMIAPPRVGGGGAPLEPMTEEAFRTASGSTPNLDRATGGQLGGATRPPTAPPGMQASWNAYLGQWVFGPARR